MRIIIGCDKNGTALKESIKAFLKDSPHTIDDVDDFVKKDGEYPDVALQAATLIKEGKYDRAILICGTGIGMSIAANKIPGIYAAVCHEIYSTERSILSNNIQVMCLGALVIGASSANRLVKEWLKLEFVDSPSTAKINSIKKIEKEYSMVD